MKRSLKKTAGLVGGYRRISLQTAKLCTHLLCVVAKTSLVVFFFCLIFRQSRYLGKCRPPSIKKNSARKKKKKWRSGLGMGMENTCAKCQDLSLKNGVNISTFMPNNK